MERDVHNLGEFDSLDQVYEKYPNGGTPGDYVMISGEKTAWNEGKNKWGDFGDDVSSLGNQTVEGNLTVGHDLTVGGDLNADQGEFNTLRVGKIIGEVVYQDDVETCDSLSDFPQPGNENKLYFSKKENKLYSWKSESYISISTELGEIEGTAYPGDKGKKNSDDIADLRAEMDALPDIPTKVSDLNNDSGFITKAVSDLTNYYTKPQTYTREEINQKIAAIKTASFEVVDTLPASGEENIIYLVPKVGGEVPDTHDEYIWVDSAWELIGSTQIDLSNYLQKTGDASDTTVTFVPEAGEPASGSKLSSLIGRIVKKLSDIVSGAIAVAKATSADTATQAAQATQDGDGNNISSTYLKRSGGQMEGVLSLRMYSGTDPGGELSFFGNNEKDSNGALLYGITSFGSSAPVSIIGTWIQSYLGLHFVGKGKTLTINGDGVAAEKFIGNLQGNATNDGDGNEISETYLKRSGGTMTGNLALSNEIRVNGAVGNLIGRFTWAGGLKAVVGNAQDTLALLSKDAATLNGSPIFTRAGGLVSGTLVQKKGNCSIHTDVASYRMPDNHTGWVRIDFGLMNTELLGVIDLIVYGKGGISIDFSGYTYVSSSNPTANNWFAPKYGIRGSLDAPMPIVRFAKDNTTGRRYIMIGGDGFAWGPYGFVSLSKVVLGSLGNTTGDLGVSIEAVSGNYADLGLTNASVSNPSVSIEVERARQDGEGNDIPSTYATKEELPDVYVDTVPSNPKDGDILITTTD